MDTLRSDGRTDNVKTEYPPTNTVCGGIMIKTKRIGDNDLRRFGGKMTRGGKSGERTCFMYLHNSRGTM